MDKWKRKADTFYPTYICKSGRVVIHENGAILFYGSKSGIQYPNEWFRSGSTDVLEILNWASDQIKQQQT